MKCQKCTKLAAVHLTEIVTEPSLSGGVQKRTVEIHLCLSHAVEAGLIVSSPGGAPQMMAVQAPPLDLPKGHPLPTSIVPVKSGGSESGLVLSRERGLKPEALLCPTCGMNWTQFKQAGLMGCPHDYDLFDLRLLPLLKRAQEGATDHVGKVPRRRKSEEAEKRVATLLLRRELQKAIDAEKYEEAATLRDQLRHLE